jgi:YggT family protein
MRALFSILGGLTGFYSILIFIRVLLSWFRGPAYGKPVELLHAATDPYLDWFRRFPLQIAHFDLSPIAAMAVLSVAQNIFLSLARTGRVTVGFILSLLLGIAWSVVSFMCGFFIIILVLRAIAYFTNRNVYASFWSIIDTLSKPVLYRISRIIFGRRLVRYSTELLVSTAALFAARIGLGLLVGLGAGLLRALPF